MIRGVLRRLWEYLEGGGEPPEPEPTAIIVPFPYAREQPFDVRDLDLDAEVIKPYDWEAEEDFE